MNFKIPIGIFTAFILFSSCSMQNKPSSQEPQCAKKPVVFNHHDISRTDNYFWLRERENPEVVAYVEAENDFLKKGMAHTEDFQTALFEEMKSRIKEDDQSVPYQKNGYEYYTRFEKGKEYPIYCRKKEGNDAEEIMLDVNELAEGKEYCQVGGLSVSPDNQWLAYAADFVSRRQYQLFVKNLITGETIDWTEENTTGSAAWANDNKTLFFTEKDPETLRSFRIWRSSPFTGEKTAIFNETDDTFYAFCYRSKSGKYIIVGSQSTLTSEYRIISSDTPHADPRIFTPRKRGVEYDIAHDGDRFIVRSNLDGRTNFALFSAPENVQTHADWTPLVEHRNEVLIEGMEVFDDKMVVLERHEGALQFTCYPKDGAEPYLIPLPEEGANIGFGNNPSFSSPTFRFGYTSLSTPSSTMEYHFASKKNTVLKQQEVLGDFDAKNYASERIIVTARDGEKVPVSLVYNKKIGTPKNAPLLLYGYGSYGYSMDPYFSTARLSLLDRGFVYAIAHIRGGEDKGRHWYENGKLLKKKNTFYDFIDCGKHLIAKGYTSADHLYAMGGSAGGLLMGAVMNMEPELFNGIVASVPFVDVINTMLDETIPLTTGEYDEWGNPNDAEYFKYILSYSPYDNVEAKAYPNLLITTGFHDSQVQYWEPAKWIAKIRELRTNNNKLYMYTNMDAGHGGASGRFSALKEVALEYAFILDLEGISK